MQGRSKSEKSCMFCQQEGAAGSVFEKLKAAAAAHIEEVGQIHKRMEMCEATAPTNLIRRERLDKPSALQSNLSSKNQRKKSAPAPTTIDSSKVCWVMNEETEKPVNKKCKNKEAEKREKEEEREVKEAKKREKEAKRKREENEECEEEKAKRLKDANERKAEELKEQRTTLEHEPKSTELEQTEPTEEPVAMRTKQSNDRSA